MAFIKSIDISQFRGIQQLTISDLSSINIIVGDNNSGKTTFLEAIQLLFAKPHLNAIRSIINQRTLLNPDKGFYTSFIKMFNIEEKNNLEFSIHADSNNGPIKFKVKGYETTVSGEEAVQKARLPRGYGFAIRKISDYIPETAKMFNGDIFSQIGDMQKKGSISCTSMDRTVRFSGISSKELNYISSFGHLRFDLLKNIVDNPEYKKLAIDILRQFDNSIADICYTKADDGSYMESIITKNGVNMPFSVYGDGIKKILYILNKLFDATDSILMIDEIETGLHKKYYDTLFPVIFALANKLNVQLFIATHSIEAIDAILRYGDYEDTDNNDPIRVITLKKIESDNGSNIAARNVTGKYVYDNRKVFEFEVRL